VYPVSAAFVVSSILRVRKDTVGRISLRCCAVIAGWWRRSKGGLRGGAVVSDLLCLADVPAAAMSWIWADRIPSKTLTVMEGPRGCGKSLLALHVAAAVTRGRLAELPGNRGVSGQPRGVILLGDEDHLASAVVPRALAAGADLHRLHTFGHSEGITLAGRLESIERAIEESDAALLVIDPLDVFLDAPLTQARAVRRELGRLLEMADRRQVTAIAIRHTIKGASSSITAGVGSYVIGARVRSILVVTKEPNQANTFFVASGKNSYGPVPPTLSFRLLGEPAPVFQWLGQVQDTADDLLRRRASNDKPRKRDMARQFLQVMLADGGVSVQGLKAKALKEAFSWPTIERAQEDLGIVSRHTGFASGSWWYWAFPNDDRPPIPPPGRIGDQIEVAIYEGPTDSAPDEPPRPAPASAMRPRSAAPSPSPSPSPTPTGSSSSGPLDDDPDPTARRFELLELD
jgi:hypothetical protein